MLELDPIVFDDTNDSGLLGRAERLLVHEPRTRDRKAGCREQRLPGFRSQPLQARPHERAKIGRHRQFLRGRPVAEALQLLCDLEGMERVSAAGLDHTQQRRPRQRRPQLVLENRLYGSEVERPERQLGTAFERKGIDEGLRPKLVHAHRSEHPDRCVLESTERVSERRRSRVVQPLRVVDCDQSRPGRGDFPQQ